MRYSLTATPVIAAITAVLLGVASQVTYADITWLPEERLTDDPQQSSDPVVATDPSGNVHLIWGGDDEIRYRCWNGIAWGPDGLLTSSGRRPAVAADPNGNVHVVWTGRDPDGIYYTRWDGEAWILEVLLTEGGAHAAVTADPSNNVHVVWSGDGGDLYYKRWDGDAWTEDERVTIGGIAQNPAVAADPGGNVHVVWEDQRDGNHEIFYKRWDGVEWTQDEQLTNSDDDDSGDPALAADPSGNVHIVWYSERWDCTDLWYKRWDGGAWTPNTLLLFGFGIPGPGGFWHPAVGADLLGNVHVVCTDTTPNTHPHISYLRWDGNEWTETESLTPWTHTSNSPALTTDPSGNVHVVWRDYRHGHENPEIYYRRGEPTTTGIQHHTAAPAADAPVLNQNSPNPFNPSTRIAFNLPHKVYASLDIYDSAGRFVRKLIDTDLARGSHSVRWDGRDGNGRAVASGVYHYRFKAGTRVTTRSMVLVR